MLSQIHQFARRHVRSLKHALSYPILLPHFKVTGNEVLGLDGDRTPLPPDLANAFRLTDGSRRLIAVARRSKASLSALLQQRDQGRVILWRERIEELRTPVDSVGTIILSPHPDDAALSAFSESNDHANSWLGLLVVNVFSKTAWWRFADEPPDISEVQRVRNAEEQLVARLIRARLKMLDLPEALLRGYDMTGVFEPPVPDRDLQARAAVAQAVKQLLDFHPGNWLLPLGVGRHVDHLLVRDAALAALEESGVPPANIMFYEDLPYAADFAGGTPDFSDLIPGRRLRVSGLHRAGEAKLECLRAYWSQLTWSQIVRVGEYGRKLGRGQVVERYWTLA